MKPEQQKEFIIKCAEFMWPNKLGYYWRGDGVEITDVDSIGEARAWITAANPDEVNDTFLSEATEAIRKTVGGGDDRK